MRLTQALARAASVNPDGPATIDGPRRRSWREVAERVARLAAGLRSLGAAPGERVAILAHNCDAYFEAYFAVLWAGAVLTPLNTRLAPKELAFQLRDAGVRVLLAGAEFAGILDDLEEPGRAAILRVAMDPGAEAVCQGRSLERLIQDHAPMDDAGRRNEDLAGIFYTGGTTGLPKGVMLSHLNLSAMASNLIMACKIDEDCVNLHAAPMFHLADIGIIMVTMVAGTHVFCRQLSDEIILDLVQAERITHIFTVPAVIDRLARSERRASLDLTSLRVLGYGGSPMPMGTYEAARAAFPDVDFIQGFGMTEMSAHTFLGPRHHRPGADPRRLRSAGQVCYGYELKVVDAKGNETPRGVTGELVGRGDNVMMGYWNRPAETAEALRDGWMHTQDLGFMDEGGFVYITDRAKDMIVTGAENVYSIEVESLLSRHPAIAECAVIGVPDKTWGERVHAVVVPRAGEVVDLQGLQSFLRGQIAGYKIPKSLAVHRDPLPRSAAGKILKQELRAAHRAG